MSKPTAERSNYKRLRRKSKKPNDTISKNIWHGILSKWVKQYKKKGKKK